MSFEKYYDGLMKKFGERFVSIKPKDDEAIEFPDGFGVMIIWLDNQDIMQLDLKNPSSGFGMMFASYGAVHGDAPFGRRTQGLLYVGKLGSYISVDGEGLRRKGAFKDLSDFCEPLRFSDGVEDEESMKHRLRLGPKWSSKEEQYNKRFKKEAYGVSLDYSSIGLDFFQFTGNIKQDLKYTPALLEAEIVTRYLLDAHKLPPVNTEL
jgi:hypothetical protein